MAFTRKEKVGKGGSNVSISLTSGNLVSQLDSIKKSAKLTEDQIDDILLSWHNLQEEVKMGAITQKRAYDEIKEKLSEYGIGINETTKQYEKQKEKIKEVETQSSVSVKNEINDQKELANEVNLVNEALQRQANILNQFRSKSLNNKLTPGNIDSILTQLGINLQKGKSQDSVRSEILNYLGYAGKYDNYYDNKAFIDYLSEIGKKPKDFNTFATGGKFNYGADFVRGLKNPNLLFDDYMTDILAMAILNDNEFTKYATSQPDFDDLMDLRNQFMGRLWNGTFKGNKYDIENYTPIFDKYLDKAINNRDSFMGSLGYMPPALNNAWNFVGSPTYRKFLQKQQEANDFYWSNYTPKQYEKGSYEDYLLYTNKHLRFGNNIIDAEYRPVGQVAEQAYNRVSEDINIINQTTQKTASEINSNILQSEYSFNGMRQALSHWGSYTVATINKISKDMALTFRDFGNSVRTMSSVMYSAIHLAQALENVMNISDSMTAIAYRLERYDVTGASRDTLLKRAFNQANNSRSDIDSYATLSQRILATGVTNGNADEAMRIASLITKSMVLGGSTAQEQKSAQLQLSQALASNILGGDELRAIRENAIGFTEMLAKGLTRGYKQGIFTDPNFANVKIGDLKGLGKKQLLTADVVTKAIGLMEDEINKDFSTMPELFSQTMAKLMNTFKQRLDEFNQEGKGLSRIVKLFQDLEKWLNSDKGKQVLDKLMTILDSFISFLENIATKLGWILDKFGGPLTAILQGYFAIKPLFMASNVLFGKTDMYGNQRGGLIGYGGLGNILTRFTQGSGLLPSLFSAENVNGTTVAMGGLFPNLFSFGFDLFKKISGSNAGDNFANTILVQTYLNKLLKQDNLKNARSIYQATKAILGGDDISHANQMLLYQIFARNRNSKNWQIEGLINPSDVATSLLAFDKNGNNVFNNLAANAAGAGVGNALGNPVANAFAAKGGIIGKALGSSAAGPIALAIAAVVGGVLIRNHFDRKTDERQLDEFISKLPNLDHLTGLQDEDRTALRDRAMSWYKSHTSGAFIGTKENWTEGEYSNFIHSYWQDAIDRNEKYFAKMVENTGKTAENTAGTLDITDEFIRNMNDIRTRSFRGELLMNGNGVNNTWNVVVHNEGDVKNIAEQIQSAVIAAQEGMLNTPVMM